MGSAIDVVTRLAERGAALSTRDALYIFLQARLGRDSILQLEGLILTVIAGHLDVRQLSRQVCTNLRLLVLSLYVKQFLFLSSCWSL